MPASPKPPRVSKAPPPPRHRIRGSFPDGGVSIIPAKSNSRSANWSKWDRIITAELHKAVALSLNFEPDDLWNPPPTYEDRLEVACDHAKNKKLRVKRRKPGIFEVDLKVFAAWAKKQGWQLPDEFPRSLARGNRRPKLHSPVADQRWYKTRIADCEARGEIPSRFDDEAAGKAEGVTRDTVRNLRNQLAPAHWQARGRRKTGVRKLATKIGDE